jgi:hypothetical protein
MGLIISAFSGVFIGLGQFLEQQGILHRSH